MARDLNEFIYDRETFEPIPVGLTHQFSNTDSTGTASAAVVGALVLAESLSKSDKTATLLITPSSSSATFGFDLEVSHDGGTTWIVASSFDNSSDSTSSVNIANILHYRFELTTAVSAGTLDLTLGG